MYKQKYNKYILKILQYGGYQCKVCLENGAALGDISLKKCSRCSFIVCENCITELLRNNNNKCPDIEIQEHG